MPRMLTSAAAILALGIGLPALAADETPKTDATGTEAAAEQTEQMPEQAADDTGMAEGQDEQAAETAMPEGEPATADEAQAVGTETPEGATGMTEGEQAAEGEQPAAPGMAEGEPAAEDTPAAVTAGDTTGSGGTTEQVDWAQYVGMPLVSDTGEELGEISTVVAGPDGQTLVIIERGGFLGLGRKQYAMMPQDLRVDGETVVAPMTSDQIAEMPEYEEPEPTE